MNVTVAMKQSPKLATNEAITNDNDWLAVLPIGATFYCNYKNAAERSYHLHERVKVWQQGPIARIEVPDPNFEQKWTGDCYVETAVYSKTYRLVHILKEEDTG